MNRILTALALIVFALYVIWVAPSSVFLVAAVGVGCLCYWEFGNLVLAHGIRRPGVVGMVIGVFIIVFPPQAFVAASLLLLSQLALSLRMATLRDILPAVGAVLTGAFYSFAPWHFASVLRSASPHLLFFAFALNWVGDSAAFYVGRQLGKHKLAPTISPGKSWEGAAASALASLLFGLVYLRWAVPELSFALTCVMSLAGNVAGQTGDLAESAMKRGAGLKDSGNLLPGHGGVLDRLDSSMFSLPMIYLIYEIWNKWISPVY